MKNIKPFGPSLGRCKVSKKFIKKLNDEFDLKLKSDFNDGELYELGMIMAVLIGVAKFTFVFDLVEKEDYCQF